MNFKIHAKANVNMENTCNLVSFLKGEYLNNILKKKYIYLQILCCDTSVTYKGVYPGNRMWDSSEMAKRFFFLRYYSNTGSNGNENEPPAGGQLARKQDSECVHKSLPKL